MPYTRGIDYTNAAPIGTMYPGVSSSSPTSTFPTPVGGSSPSGVGGNLNITSRSTGLNTPFSNPIPDFRFADPSTLSRLDISNLIWSPTAGGYLTANEANNANSYYNKFGAGQGGDPAANRAASAYYNYVGGLPTQPIGTPALNQFYSLTGQQPAPGPSYNSILGGIFNNASPYMQGQLQQAGFGPTYQGPYGYGRT